MSDCARDRPLFDLNDTITLQLLEKLANFRSFYGPIHGYICVGLCVFGILTNLVHVLVLSRPTMRNSAVNCILTAVAVCDIGTMVSYLIYIVHFVILKDNNCSPRYTHGWMQFLLWHVVLSITLHTTSLWLAVAMAFLRRMTLRVARLNSFWQRPQFAWKICSFIYVAVLVLCCPNMFVHEIIQLPSDANWRPSEQCANEYPQNYSETIYTFAISSSAVANNCRLFKWNIWMIGIVFKIIPCFLLLLLSIGLVMKIRDAERHRRKLTNGSNMTTDAKSAKKKTHKTDRTTVMLVVILIVFLITELPQGLIAILCAIYTADVHRFLYFYLGDILDLLSLLNSSVNFILYCLMSSRYRQTFWTVVLPTRAYALVMKRATTPSNFNFSQIPMQRKNSNKIRNKEYTPLATDDINLRECPSPLSDSERVEQL
ncbi:unnamed protein product [Auanema sp. JU1783]|nr:unnamed protein product [Auanema sp. JU1783]